MTPPDPPTSDDPVVPAPQGPVGPPPWQAEPGWAAAPTQLPADVGLDPSGAPPPGAPGPLAPGPPDVPSSPGPPGAPSPAAGPPDGADPNRTRLVRVLAVVAVLVAVLGGGGAYALSRATTHTTPGRSAAPTTTAPPHPHSHRGHAVAPTTTAPGKGKTTPGKATTTTVPKTATTAPGATTTTTPTSSATTAPPHYDMATETPTDALSIAVTAMNTAKTMDFAETTTSSGTVEGKSIKETESDTQQVSPTAGIQTISLKSATGTLSGTEYFVDRVAYLKGNATALEQQFHTTTTKANEYAGKWISVEPTDPDYATAQATMVLSQVEAQFEPAAPLTATGVSTVDGHQVVGVSGSLPSAFTHGTSALTGTEVLYIQTAAPYTPVEETLHASGSSGNGATAVSVTITSTTTFSGWGSALTVTAPSGAISAKTVEPTTTGGTHTTPTTPTTVQAIRVLGAPAARGRLQRPAPARTAP